MTRNVKENELGIWLLAKLGRKDHVGEGKFLLKRKLYGIVTVKRIPSVRNSPHSLPLIQPVISFDRLYCAARRPLYPFSLPKPECNYPNVQWGHLRAVRHKH